MKQSITKFVVRLYNEYFFKTSLFRTLIYRPFLKKCGKRVFICKQVTIMGPQNVELGNNVYIGKYATIAGQAGVKIGNDTIINHDVNIISVNHVYEDSTKRIEEQGFAGGPIIIGDDVWIGTGAVILPNTKIGKGAVVGANAVVTKDVELYTVVAGVPAKLIKRRNPSKEKA